MKNQLTNQQQNSTHLSAERAEHREWIGGRAATLLAHYWRENDDPALLAAIGKDWADVLEGLPQKYIQLACIRYQQEEPRRKPTPGAIYAMTVSLMPKIKIVKPEDPRPEPRCSKEAAQEIMKAAGIKPRAF